MLECTGSKHEKCYEMCTYKKLKKAVKHWKSKKPCTEKFQCELTGQTVWCKEGVNERQ